MGVSVHVRTCTLHLLFRVLAWIGWFKVDDCGISSLELIFSRHGTCKLLCDTSLALARSSPTRRYTGLYVLQITQSRIRQQACMIYPPLLYTSTRESCSTLAIVIEWWMMLLNNWCDQDQLYCFNVWHKMKQLGLFKTITRTKDL